MKNEFVLLNYTPDSAKQDRISKAPQFISQTFTCLQGTAFSEYGIYCSFGSHDPDEAFIFARNLAAKINYVNDSVIHGPMKLSKMFPFLKNTVFEKGIDTGFESTNKNEAYIFRGDQFGVLNHGPSPKMMGGVGRIPEGLPGLRKTMFESGIEEAFASHREGEGEGEGEAYVFKGDSFAVINFVSGGSNIGGTNKIVGKWSPLHRVLPSHNVSVIMLSRVL